MTFSSPGSGGVALEQALELVWGPQTTGTAVAEQGDPVSSPPAQPNQAQAPMAMEKGSQGQPTWGGE